MRNMVQLLGGVAVAGAVAAGSTAFTANSGLAFAGSSTGTATQFVGGQVTQTVTGATISTVAYAFADGAAKTQVNGVTITFSDSAANGKTVTLTPGGGAYGDVAVADQFYCPAVSGTSVTCVTALSTDNTHAQANYYTRLGSLQILVA
jgi:hypothetical protein